MTLSDLELDLLRSLDAAPAGAVSDRDRLAEILDSPVPPSRIRPGRRLAVLGAVAASAAVAVPVSGLLGTDAAAYESWTPAPTQLAETDRAAADAACRDADLDVSGPEPRLAERRGDWAVLQYAGRRGEVPVVVTCMARVPAGSASADDVDLAWVGGLGAVPTDAEYTDGGLVQLGGHSLLGRDRPEVAVVQGDVGPDVATLTFRLDDGRTVVATVAGGHYVAWWPGRAVGADGSDAFTVTVTTVGGRRTVGAAPTSPR